MSDPPRPTRDRTEIAEAIRGLTAAQLLRLRKVGQVYAALVADMDRDDLLQEAFRRALDGERACPADVDVVRFLAEAMRSIASGERAKTGRRSRSTTASAAARPLAVSTTGLVCVVFRVAFAQEGRAPLAWRRATRPLAAPWRRCGRAA